MRRDAVVVVKHPIAMRRVQVVAPREEARGARKLLAVKDVIEVRIVGHDRFSVTLAE